MSIFRTIAMFTYLFGYMIVHYGVLRKACLLYTSHAAQTIDARRPGVGVARLVLRALHLHGKGIVAPVLVAGQVD